VEELSSQVTFIYLHSMINKAPPRDRLVRKKATELPSGSVYDRDCPARVMLDRLADKWTVLVIGQLAAGTMRFAELRRAIDGVSQKMLTSTLRDLERDGLVKRQLYASVPPKVEYSLTPLGTSLVNQMKGLCLWAEEHIDQVRKARENFDRQKRLAQP
jgi:DNA-binding HxlR family transcriptional regulator